MEVAAGSAHFPEVVDDLDLAPADLSSVTSSSVSETTSSSFGFVKIRDFNQLSTHYRGNY
jgi:hypothetical protein